MQSATKQSAQWVEVGRVEDIPVLGARVVETDQGNIAVFRTEDDGIFALHDECPHKKGPLSQGIVYGNSVACPLHNWSIELGSGHAVAPDEGSTACFPVRVEGGLIHLCLESNTTC